MRVFPRSRWLVLALALAASGGCGGGGGTKPRACADDLGCASGSRCIQGSCAANAPPVAKIALPESAAAFELLTFDGGASADADAPLDGVVSYAWSFAAVSAPCAPPVSATTTAQAVVRFGCPGRFAVQLIVTDAMGVPSAPVVRELDVSPRTPLVEVSPDLAVEHLCAGEPLVCRPEGTVALSAATPTATGDVAYRWTVEPPANRPLDAGRRVTFDPSPDVAAPAAVIETDGAAISGDWIFRVTATDAAGSLGEAAIRVSVGNRPPAITAQVPLFNHAFDAAYSFFAASGAITVSVVDPDGDLIVRRDSAWRHVGDGGAQFTGIDDGDRLTVDVRVPYASPADALFLIGGEGLERSVELTVEDANGAVTPMTWPIEIRNRAPSAPSLDPDRTIPHVFSAATGTFTATGTIGGTWSDPDGDPLFAAGPTGDVECPTYEFVRTAEKFFMASISCSAPYLTQTSLENFAQAHLVTVAARDPWATAKDATATLFDVTNTPPVFQDPAVLFPSACDDATTCCDYDPVAHRCDIYANRYESSTVRVQSLFRDPDGDPLDVTVGSTTQRCPGSGEGCAFDVTAPAANFCETAPRTSIDVTAFDGATTVTSTIADRRTCS